MKKLIYSKEDLDLILSLENENKDKEIERLNKRINELEDRLEKQRNNELEKLSMKAARLGIPSSQTNHKN